MFKQIAIGLVRVGLAVVVGSIVGGLAFAAIDAMRLFQADTIASSVSRTAIAANPFSTELAEPGLFGLISRFVDWYSTLFFGYSRFGAGLFMIAGAFWAMGRAQTYHAAARGTIGFFAGFLIGTRFAMFILQRPELVLAIAVNCAVLCCLGLILAGRPSAFKSLPKLQLKHDS
jgi:hypothetical protein